MTRKTTEQRERQRAANRVQRIRTRAQAASNGHQLVVIACNAAQAASRRINDTARRGLAQAIAETVERFDTPTNQKERG